jgi:hypothetical protein
MRLSRVLLACVAVPLVAAAAFASTELAGQLQGAPIPAHYKLLGADLYFHDGKPFIEVNAEGDCHYEFHQECYWNGGNPPQYVCHNVPTWVCVRDFARFAMPNSIVLRDKDVYYVNGGQNVKIGHVKSFLFWKWIKLHGNASIAATHASATLRIQDGAPRADRQETFAKLHAEPSVDLMVKFQNVSVVEARALLRDNGYQGELAPTNDWREGDVTRDEIGVRLPVKSAAALIAKLKTSTKVVGVRPAGTNATE